MKLKMKNDSSFKTNYFVFQIDFSSLSRYTYIVLQRFFLTEQRKLK